MPNESSEIAESRGFGENCMCDSPEFPHESPEFVRIWRKAGCSACARNPERICDQCQERIAVASAATQRAERDTRERCAHLAPEIAEHIGYKIQKLLSTKYTNSLLIVVGIIQQELAERIRGKE